MKIWLPYISAGSGSDVFTKRLAIALNDSGHSSEPQAFPHKAQYFPWLLRNVQPPPGTDIVVANSWNAFSFNRPDCPLVVVEHHCVLDPVYSPYRSVLQGLFHHGLVRLFERNSFRAADYVVAVSDYTAKVVRSIFPDTQVQRIYNGIDTAFFTPTPKGHATPSQFTLLFVGNNTKRKGADLLPDIMKRLPSHFVLRYTGGLRDNSLATNDSRFQSTGRLTDTELREEYRRADALIFPTRYEGFGYAAAEAMACGTPVITSDCSSLPEVIRDEETGILCPTDDAEAFANAARRLSGDPDLLARMGESARQHVLAHFSISVMVKQYLDLFMELVESSYSNHQAPTNTGGAR